ncbi:MAG: ParB N-terminal domain-containing protein [Ferruginibacter sp.]
MQLELTPHIMGNRETVRQNTQRSEEIVKIELSKIVIRNNFNVREDYGDIESLAYSILENGQTVAGRVDVLNDGTFVLTDGHRRFKALQLLETMGHDPFFKAVVNSTKTTEEQRILQMFTTQDNKPLQPHEISELINRLINLGHTQASVAKKIGKTAGYISQMMQFANESPAIKNEVKNGNINVSAVLKLQKDIPIQSERIEAVKKAVSNKKEGKTVKAVEVTGKSHKEIKNEKFQEVAERLILAFDLSKEDDLPTIITILSNYF